MTKPHLVATEEEHKFWEWILTSLMPFVSKDWSDRLKGKRIVKLNETGGQEMEKLGDYLTCSDFAYVPMVVRVYGGKKIEEDDNNRKRGRKQGQSGMMSKENIAQYVESMLQMRSVLDRNDNRENVESWGDAAFKYIESEDQKAENRDKLRAAAYEEATRALAEQNIRKKKRDEIMIPV